MLKVHMCPAVTHQILTKSAETVAIYWTSTYKSLLCSTCTTWQSWLYESRSQTQSIILLCTVLSLLNCGPLNVCVVLSHPTRLPITVGFKTHPSSGQAHWQNVFTAPLFIFFNNILTWKEKMMDFRLKMYFLIEIQKKVKDVRRREMTRDED